MDSMDRMAAALKQLALKVRAQDDLLQQLTALAKASSDSPKWIEDIVGKRVPYFGVVNLTITADSGSKVTGTHNVTEDGPFVITAIAAFFKKTSGSYANDWGYATNADQRIAPTGQQHGFRYLYDSPVGISGDFEIIAHGADRQWQSNPIASALMNKNAGGAYVFPVAYLTSRNSSIEVSFTPGASIPDAGTLQVLLCGYKIVQGSEYQP